jgi:type I restriction enzyme M protein
MMSKDLYTSPNAIMLDFWVFGVSESQPWVLSRYEKLWSAFGDRRFTRDEALKVLRELEGDAFSEESLNVLLSEMRKAGLVVVESDILDARRKIYMLRGPKKLSDLLVERDLTRGELESLMKRAADLIRTRVDYEFILILLFLKRVSDKWMAEYKMAYEEAIADGFSPDEADREARSSVYHDFVLTDECLWDNIRKDPNRLAENLSKALKVLADKNPELQGVVDRADFIRFAESPENLEILRQLVELFSQKRLYEVSPDILGDAYEWVLRYFAPEKAKEGEIYTPREVIRLMVEMLDPRPGEKVYDPCCGSGGMLILSYKHVEAVYGKDRAREVFLYGQEANPKIRAYCKMNLYIHDIRDADIQLGDTLLYPKHPLGFADVVLANPPWNQDGYDEDVLKKGELWKQRYIYGFTSKQSADWAWIQHMLAMAKNEGGRVGVVIDNGCLFRGGKEGDIRRKIVEAYLVDCVLLLPEKLFYNTGAPGAIIIFRKNKPAERKEKILFINASNEYIKHPTVRKLNTLSEDNIRHIVEAYKRFEDLAGFSKVVGIEEIRKNDYNLNVTLYVMPNEEKEEIDILKEFQELKELEKERQDVMMRVEQYILGIAEAMDNESK